MSVEMLHLYARLALTAWATAFLTLGARSLLLAFREDYGWPWRRRPVVNGRSHLDLDIVVREGLFALLGLVTVVNTVNRAVEGRGLAANAGSIIWSVYMAVFAIYSYRVWRNARRERNGRRAAHE